LQAIHTRLALLSNEKERRTHILDLIFSIIFSAIAPAPHVRLEEHEGQRQLENTVPCMHGGKANKDEKYREPTLPRTI
jgi:hypothetical protein